MMEIIEQLQYVISMAAGGSITIGGMLLKDKISRIRRDKYAKEYAERIKQERKARFEAQNA